MRYLSVALLFVASTAVAQSWQQITRLDSNGGVLFVDASDIMEVKGYRRAWFKWAYETDQPVPGEHRDSVPKSKTYRWIRSANLFHCTQQTTALAEQRWFNAKDKDLGSRRAETLDFRKISPGSVDQQMLEAVCSSESVRSLERLEEQAQMTRPVQPKDYYPQESIRRGEQGAATVKVCVDSTGKLLREPVVTVSSGFEALDGAALQVAKDSRYKPGVRDGAALAESCLEVPVAFRQLKNFSEIADLRAKVEKPANPHDYYPRDARARREEGSPVVQACVGGNGKLVRDPVISESSGFPALDAAAIEVARATRYSPARIDGVVASQSCIMFRVKFGRKPELVLQ
jgi:TonB family protein